MMIDVRYGRCGRVLVSVRGSFDGRAADRIHELLASSDPARPVIVDFRETRLVEPSALAALAGDTLEPGQRLTVTGLSQGHRRMLRDLAGPSRSSRHAP
jgi:anti-anti-sigma regulatory factor